MEDPSVVNPVPPALVIAEPQEHIVVNAVLPIPENVRVVDYIHQVHQPRVSFRNRMFGILLCCMGVALLLGIGLGYNYHYRKTDY
jgi:hypothetical protein